jgi:hypothetical protein
MKNYDAWKTSPPPEEAEEICDTCGCLMEWEEDGEYDPESGRVVSSGGGWECTNKHCGEKEETDEEPT